MNALQRFFAQGSPHMLSVFRIIVALLFMQHGGQKILGFPPSERVFQLDALGYTAGVLELFGGLLLAIGLFVRPTAFVLAGQMAVAYFMAHFPAIFENPMGFFPIVNRGEAAVFYCFAFLYLLFAGGGSLSLDSLIWGRRKAAQEQRVESTV